MKSKKLEVFMLSSKDQGVSGRNHRSRSLHRSRILRIIIKKINHSTNKTIKYGFFSYDLHCIHYIWWKVVQRRFFHCRYIVILLVNNLHFQTSVELYTFGHDLQLAPTLRCRTSPNMLYSGQTLPEINSNFVIQL